MHWPGKRDVSKSPKSSPTLLLGSPQLKGLWRGWGWSGEAKHWAGEGNIENELSQWRSTGLREPRRGCQTQHGKHGIN